MMKLILIGSALIAGNAFGFINLSVIPHLGDYAKVLLVALALMPWVTRQLDG